MHFLIHVSVANEADQLTASVACIRFGSVDCYIPNVGASHDAPLSNRPHLHGRVNDSSRTIKRVQFIQ